jgi:hypothetical protein
MVIWGADFYWVMLKPGHPSPLGEHWEQKKGTSDKNSYRPPQNEKVKRGGAVNVTISFWRMILPNGAHLMEPVLLYLKPWIRFLLTFASSATSSMWMDSRNLAPHFLHGSLINCNARDVCWLWSRISATRIAESARGYNAMPNMASMNTVM